ncbi:hypothetical protein BXY70_2208 [Roseovarius halotolerans]|uniref:Uncharacterized protein n=1 Tax=Roseovarius halotolerans TaxID=505353 RepID=A0A1X6YX10_9RHOB|nr:hypothetical protein [Roseovarius halotolerans]RKT32858.1 hypothetical protein BXY70_2208 [Roseovarius halotolerans]SLN31797.1 hypothetical protein ROH8110_01497 [Roseovarius halotolerans]
MPLSILVPLVTVGILGIALLLHLLGLSRPVALSDESAARDAWLSEFPDDAPLRVLLSRNRMAALVETPKGRGVVWPMGADTTARYLTGARITRRAEGLRISLPDYTAPRIDLVLDEAETGVWAAPEEQDA